MATEGAINSVQAEEIEQTSVVPLPDPTTTTKQDQHFRSHVGHISRHSGIFFLGTLFSATFGYLFKIYLARVLGAEALGLYALGMTLVSFIGIFNMLGLSHSAMRYVAVYQVEKKFDRLHALLWSGGGILLLASLGFGAILLVTGPQVARRFYHSPVLAGYIPFFAVMMILGVLSAFYGRVLAGYKDLKRRTIIVNFIGVPLTMILSVAFIAVGAGLKGYLAGQILSSFAVVVLLIIAVRAVTPKAARFSSYRWSGIHREVWSFSTMMLGLVTMEFFISQADRISLGYFRSARDVGIYSVAAAVVAYVPLILNSVNQIFSPTIADLHTRGEYTLLARLFQSLTKWILGMTLPLVAVIIIFARPLMRIFGHQFEAGWAILVIGAVGQLVNCGVGSVGWLLAMSGNENRLMRVQVVMTLFMVTLSALLIPMWGMYGAAIAAAGTNIGINLLNLWQVQKVLNISPYNRSYAHLLAPTLAAVAIALIVRANIPLLRHDWLAIGTAAVLAYGVFAGVIMSFGLDADDRLIMGAIRTRFQTALPPAFRGVQ
jgi:O-antigen/teichoic acid export membrane protein